MLILGLACIASGCFPGHLPPLEFYSLMVPDSATVVTNLAQPPLRLSLAAGSIGIAPYEAPGLYGDVSIVYRVDDASYGAYPSRRWAEPLPAMLGMITEDVLRRAPITAGAATFAPPSYQTEAFVWHGLVREFEEVDRGRSVSVTVALEARITRASDDSLLWTGTVRLEQPVPQGTMPAIVSGLSALSVAAVNRLADEARAALIHAGTTGRPAR